MTETILTNANIVLAEEIVAGTIQVKDGRIADVATRSSTCRGPRTWAAIT